MNQLFTGIYNRFSRKSLAIGPAVNVGGGVVGMPCTAHGYVTGDPIVITGTTNYDGSYTVLSTTTTDQINITAAYVAETFAATDYAESSFYNLLSGRLYHVKAPQGATYPYCVYWMVTGDDDLNFTDENQIIQIQFDIVTQNSSALSAGAILDAMFYMFDDCTLTITGYRHLYMIRDWTIPNNDLTEVPPIMGYSVQYDVEIERAK